MSKTIEQLTEENEYLRNRFKEGDLLFGKLILAMRAAVIEAEHGEGPAAGMDWIFNTLAGPGEFAPEEETDAQAYYDRGVEKLNEELSTLFDYFSARREMRKAAGQVKP